MMVIGDNNANVLANPLCAIIQNIYTGRWTDFYCLFNSADV